MDHEISAIQLPVKVVILDGGVCGTRISLKDRKNP
jgi:hypothetical protein